MYIYDNDTLTANTEDAPHSCPSITIQEEEEEEGWEVCLHAAPTTAPHPQTERGPLGVSQELQGNGLYSQMSNF